MRSQALAQQEVRVAARLLSERTKLTLFNRNVYLHLTVARLILGKKPTRQALQYYGLGDAVGGLIEPLVKGNVSEYVACVERYAGWWLKKRNWLLLLERGKMVCYRNLIRRVYVEITCGVLFVLGLISVSIPRFLLTPQPAKDDKVPPSLMFDTVFRAIQLACRGKVADAEDPEDVESLLISLIDQVSLLDTLTSSGTSLNKVYIRDTSADISTTNLNG